MRVCVHVCVCAHTKIKRAAYAQAGPLFPFAPERECLV